MLLRRSALLFVLLAPLASADVQFTSPAAGAKAAGGSALTVEWKDSGSAPSISDLKGYQLFVCAGSNTNTAPTCASLEDQGVFSGGNKASAPIPVGFGASTPPNA
ncbi:MAG: hypothetical protein M1832_000233 [Thelocarpon impressellum]|nr:MAG: hypothetical protein M1832_000233 [Thelocarpon impressellum]